MKCPVCKTTELTQINLEDKLPANGCGQCGGKWLSSFRYYEWLQFHGSTLPEKPYEGPPLAIAERQDAKLCPECRRILVRYAVGHGTNLTLDHCGSCNGVWLDTNEWEALKGRNLHDEIHLIFTRDWQTQVRKEERKKHLDAIYARHFGTDYEEIKRVRQWLDQHPERGRIVAFLTDSDPFSA
jgi:Zn-finger nucleic acid-binding protein